MAGVKIQCIYKTPIQAPPAAHSTRYKSFTVASERLVILSKTHSHLSLSLGRVRQDSLNNNQKDTVSSQTDTMKCSTPDVVEQKEQKTNVRKSKVDMKRE